MRRRPISSEDRQDETDRWLLLHLTLGSLGIGLVVAAVVFAFITMPHPSHGEAARQAPGPPAAAAGQQP